MSHSRKIVVTFVDNGFSVYVERIGRDSTLVFDNYQRFMDWFSDETIYHGEHYCGAAEQQEVSDMPEGGRE